MWLVLEGAWQPFSFGLDSISGKEADKKYSKSSLDSLDFHNLVKDIAEVTNQMRSETVETNLLKNMYLLQYLIIALESDFLPRNTTYQDNLQWTLLRESLLFKLLGSRKIVYKVLIKDCLHIMSELPRWTSISEEIGCFEEIFRDGNLNPMRL
ncbi:hypothetical protein M569_13815 [Genlisea aurea]|uniref:Uncharacterized protein n=1 Tax=Genlisea aurea TaxID=192259 RepID=S8DMT0_9LAMI|nr:hypothetical protein M569_13815 [Genlisea aurea]